MAPFTQNEKTIRTCFSRLRRLKEKINKYIKPKPLKHLSMGMSNDYEIAIEEGSTQIRLGTVLFGKRVESQKLIHVEKEKHLTKVHLKALGSTI